MNKFGKILVVLSIVAVLLAGCGGAKGYCADSTYTYSDPGNPNYPYGMCKKDGSTVAAINADQWLIDGRSPSSVPQSTDQNTQNLNHMVDKAQDAGNPVDNVNRGLTSAQQAADNSGYPPCDTRNPGYNGYVLSGVCGK